jgi:hypothetical protein
MNRIDFFAAIVPSVAALPELRGLNKKSALGVKEQAKTQKGPEQRLLALRRSHRHR